jgi:hypothetical protein
LAVYRKSSLLTLMLKLSLCWTHWAQTACLQNKQQPVRDEELKKNIYTVCIYIYTHTHTHIYILLQKWSKNEQSRTVNQVKQVSHNTLSSYPKSPSHRKSSVARWLGSLASEAFHLELPHTSDGLLAPWRKSKCPLISPSRVGKEATIYLKKTQTTPGWWFESLWKILVSWYYYSQYMEK